MKKTVLVLVLLSLTETAFADIPIKGQEVQNFVFGGKKAEDKFNAIESALIAGNSSGWSGKARK